MTDLEQQILNLRKTLLIASYCYYELNNSPYSDDMFDNWARTLRTLQAKHPTNKINFYDDAFADWDGTTGFHLPRDEFVGTEALKLLSEY